MESEKKTEKYLNNMMQLKGGISFKFTSPMMRGVPDRICIFPTGYTIFVEVKSENDKPKAHQERMISYMRSKGATVYVVYNKQDVDTVINQHIKGD